MKGKTHNSTEVCGQYIISSFVLSNQNDKDNNRVDQRQKNERAAIDEAISYSHPHQPL